MAVPSRSRAILARILSSAKRRCAGDEEFIWETVVWVAVRDEDAVCSERHSNRVTAVYLLIFVNPRNWTSLTSLTAQWNFVT